MASAEGAMRIKRVGKTLLLGGLSSVLLGTFTALLQGAFAARLALQGIVFLLLAYFGILPFVVGACLWISGWIVEGFLRPPSPDQSQK